MYKVKGQMYVCVKGHLPGHPERYSKIEKRATVRKSKFLVAKQRHSWDSHLSEQDAGVPQEGHSGLEQSRVN